MTLLSLDPRFDFTTCNTSMLYCLSLPKAPHKPFRSRRKQKKKKLCYALVRKYTPLSDLRVPFEEYKVYYAFSWEKFKNSKLLRREIGKMTLFQELFHFSTTQGNMLAKRHKSHLRKECVGITFMYSHVS